MKTRFRSRLGWGVVPSLLLATFVFQGVGRTQPPPLTTGTVSVGSVVEMYNTDRRRVDVFSQATLFQNGQPVKSAEVNSSYGTDRATWVDLPKGVYELHFETPGFGTVVKRVVVSAGQNTKVVLAELTKQDASMGMGPTLFDLQRKITLLESRMATIEKAPK